MNIAIVDDSFEVRLVLKKLVSLDPRVSEIFEFYNSADIIGFFGNNPDKTDLLILDLKLQKSNGIEVLRFCKSMQAKPLIIVLTGYTTPEIKEQCYVLGADYFFDKAGEIEKVLDVIKLTK